MILYLLRGGLPSFLLFDSILCVMSFVRPLFFFFFSFCRFQPAVVELLEDLGLRPEFQQRNEGCVELKPASLEAYIRRCVLPYHE